MAVQMLKFLLSCQGDLEIRQRKLFGPKEIGSVGVGPNRSIVINKSKYTVLVTSWEHVEAFRKKPLWIVHMGVGGGFA